MSYAIRDIIEKNMFLTIGLGNPKRKYKKTRHNIGFRILDEIKNKEGFPRFKKEKKFDSEISIKGTMILLKPQTFMNNSGKAIKPFLNYYKIPTENIVVIHDDLDLTLGEIKISKKRGSAGHNGIQSIINELKTNDFTRIRIGIKSKNQEKNFVLKRFSKQEEKTLKKAIKKAQVALELITLEGCSKAMSQLN